MGNIWTITRHTLAGSIRQKTAMFLVLILAVLMLGLPFATKGDDTLSGAVQSFLSYSMAVLGFLLTCATIFMSKTVSDDLTGRQILMLMTKPLARWQYVLGKWLGIVLLDGAILTLSGFVIYAMTMFIAGQPRGLYLAYGVCALVAILLMVIVVRGLKPERFVLTRWATVVGLCLLIGGSATAGIFGLKAYHEQLRPRDGYDQERLENQVLTARYGTKFILPKDEFRQIATQQFEKNAAEGIYANVENLNRDQAKQKLYDDIERRWRSVAPTEGREFEFSDIRCSRSPDELIHLSYRLRVFGYPPDEILRCSWIVGDRTKGAAQYRIDRRDVIDRRHTLAVPADAVAPDGTLSALFVNANPWVQVGEEQAPNVVLFEGDDAVEVLFAVSTFGSNLVRALALVFCRLMLVAAIAVMLTTVLSFPVACLAAFTAFIVAAMPDFLNQAFDWLPDGTLTRWFAIAMHYVLWVIYNIFLPKFTEYDGAPTLVEGRNVTLMWVLLAIGRLVLIQTFAVLLVACLFFRRREVSEVSV